ncbi:RNA polymerase factor sigma-54 [Marinicellulosiphila megalodicopiae]|uniref:RNA polymerase factor sigma-54 n=1 Tax=Marinicellulosiphila megalodicopiae TaxID=2724896 RepID=UPI003BAEE3DD
MKTSLQLKMGQHLTMTPQLQQAIRLLQLSTLDLQQEIQQVLESNPMLEVNDEEPSANNNEQDQNSQKSAENEISEPNKIEETDSQWEENIPDELAVDTSWDDIYPNLPTNMSAPSGDDINFDSFRSETEDLQDHLFWQLNLTPMNTRDRIIAESIIESCGNDGYLKSTIEEIFSGLSNELNEEGMNEEQMLELDELEAVLHRVQQFDPPGVCAIDLSDCLTIQLKQLPLQTEYLEQAKLIVKDFLPQLGSRDYQNILRKTKFKDTELQSILVLIQSLNPRPGDSISEDQAQYVVPDVFVRKDIENNKWLVELNPDIAPKLHINSGYAELIKRNDASSDNDYLKTNLSDAKWFIKSLHSRNETLLKVATKIVEHQRGFLDYGEEAMKPLVLHDIALDVDMHESTISRVTTQKYMHTPRGIFELKYFFSSHVSTANGGECSSTAIRAMIKKIISEENTKKPYSDSKLATLLDQQGIKVARRTIAKYREAMHIPPSNERKSLM